RGRTGPRRPVDSATWAQPRRPRPRTPHPGGARAGGTRPWPRPAAFPVNGGKPTTLPPMHRLLITLPLLAAPVGAAGAAEPRADWHVVAGGGGESAAGRFAIRGTAAQHEAEEVPLCSADGGLACA